MRNRAWCEGHEVGKCLKLQKRLGSEGVGNYRYKF